MRRQRQAIKIIQNSRGMLSAEFLFALTLSAGLCIVLFALNFTLSMAEVSQYIAFSSARAHAAGHLNQEKQTQLGKEKFESLINNPVLKPLLNRGEGGWFQLSGFEIRGGGASESSFAEDYTYEEGRVPQVGVRFKFVPKVLNIKIAFLGSTSESGEDFAANITGLLIREPTQQECWDQVKVRYSTILNLDTLGRYKTLGNSGANAYVPMEDNGC